MDGSIQTDVRFEGCSTIPQLFRKRYTELGDAVAMREKKLGIWRALSWREYGEHAKRVGLGLMSLGLERDDVVAILSEDNKEWLFADMGIVCAGGVTNGVYTTDSPKQLQYLLNDSRAKFLFVENEEQLDKWLEIKDAAPGLEKVFVFDMEGLRDFADPKVMSYDALERLGVAYEHEHPDAWDAAIDAAEPDDLMILIYTSGTTGPPKGAMICHRNVLTQIRGGLMVTPMYEGDEQLGFLPLCHIAERTFSVYWPLGAKSIVNFAESPETVMDNMREVAPTVFLAVPRVWERIYSNFLISLQDATWLGRLAYAWAIGIGQRRADAIIEGRTPSLGTRVLFAIADLLVLRNVKTLIGLRRIRWMLTSAAPISPDLIRWYLSLGLNMFELYGQTECTGAATGNNYEHYKVGTVGVAYPETEVKLSRDGEILVKGPHVFLGYLNNPEKTAETVIDGWLHTGDVGTIDNQGFFRVTDRMKDIIITAGGKNVTPSEIENQLKFSPYISDAVVIGDKRKYLSALIMIDHENVTKYAQDKSVPFSNYASLCRAQEVQDLIGAEIDKVNRDFARVEQIKTFRLIDQMLTAEDEELTPTMKLKRSFVNEKYKELIDSMYQAA